MPVLARPEGSIYYQSTGTGSPALLLSHGFAASSAMFAPNISALSLRNLVLTWDLRGHGRSEYPTDPACYSSAAALADIAALLDAAGLERAVLGGQSLGGYLSLAFALKHPHRVAGLVLIDTGPGFRNEAARNDWNRRANDTAARLAERGLAAVGGSGELHDDEHRDATGLALAARGTLTQQDSHVLDGLPNIAVPTLIIVGAQDTPFLGAADYMAAKIPDRHVVVIPDAGHAPNIDKPSLFNAQVQAFLDRVAAPKGVS